jgi:hypothetical protein
VRPAFLSFVLSPLLGLLVLLTPALAADPPIGSRLGQRLEVAPKVKDDSAAVRTYYFVRCVVSKRRDNAELWLRTLDADLAAKALPSVMRMVRCNTYDSSYESSEIQQFNIPREILRGLVAEHLLSKPGASKLLAKPIERVYSRTWFAVTGRDIAIDEMATCVADTSPSGILQILSAEPMSIAETAAIRALTPSLGLCLRANATLKGNRPSMRAALAEALYQRTIEPSSEGGR